MLSPFLEKIFMKTFQAFPVTKIPLNNLDASLQDLHNKFWIKVHKAGDIPIMQAR